ncbi:hypothetical protein Holit_00916 [Hollandina sp. SP2]
MHGDLPEVSPASPARIKLSEFYPEEFPILWAEALENQKTA